MTDKLNITDTIQLRGIKRFPEDLDTSKESNRQKHFMNNNVLIISNQLDPNTSRTNYVILDEKNKCDVIMRRNQLILLKKQV